MASLLELPQMIRTLPSGIRVINVTEHPLRFVDADGTFCDVPPCGFVLLPDHEDTMTLAIYMNRHLYDIHVVGYPDTASLYPDWIYAPFPMPGDEEREFKDQRFSAERLLSFTRR